LGGSLSILLIPLIAMQFTNEVQWSVFDFIVAGVLLSGTGVTLELLLRKFKTFKTRFIAGAILFIIFFLIWVELAVGIFGTLLLVTNTPFHILLILVSTYFECIY
jgi:hypothetical protein